MIAGFICHNRYASDTSGYTPVRPSQRRNNGIRRRSDAKGKQHYRDHDKDNGSLVQGSLLYLSDSDIMLIRFALARIMHETP
jgi:hypothetical protein